LLNETIDVIFFKDNGLLQKIKPAIKEAIPFLLERKPMHWYE